MRTEAYIKKFNPCRDSQRWLNQFGTMREAWEACERGDWMLSMAALIKIDRRPLVGAAGRCAATVKHLMKDPRSLAALDACEKFAAGEIDTDELHAAASAAASAAADAAADASYAAADAAARAAADASYAAADSAADAAARAAADASYAAYATNQKQTANICREILTESVIAALSAAERGKK